MRMYVHWACCFMFCYKCIQYVMSHWGSHRTSLQRSHLLNDSNHRSHAYMLLSDWHIHDGERHHQGRWVVSSVIHISARFFRRRGDIYGFKASVLLCLLLDSTKLWGSSSAGTQTYIGPGCADSAELCKNSTTVKTWRLKNNRTIEKMVKRTCMNWKVWKRWRAKSNEWNIKSISSVGLIISYIGLS